MKEIFPWQRSAWARLCAQRAQARLPHALMLTGPEGLGKGGFADRLAHWLFCEEQEDHPCGHCSACTLMAAGTHPDFINLEPVEAGKAITIAQIRGLIEKFISTAQRGAYRVAIVNPADTLNTAAANALLKTLEEPGKNVMLILVASHPTRLPATVRSRCQELAFVAPSLQETTQWLSDEKAMGDKSQLLASLAERIPLRALALGEEKSWEEREGWFKTLYDLCQKKVNPIAAAKQFAESEGNESMITIASWLQDIIRMKFNGGDAWVHNSDKKRDVIAIASRSTTTDLFFVLDKAVETLNALQRHKSLNRLLMFENLFISLQEKLC